MTFRVIDYSGRRWTGRAVAEKHGIALYIDGYGTKGQEGGAPIYLDFFHGYPMLYVWADKESEDPTVNVGFSKANERMKRQ